MSHFYVETGHRVWIRVRQVRKAQAKIGSDPVFLYNSDIWFIMDFLR